MPPTSSSTAPRPRSPAIASTRSGPLSAGPSRASLAAFARQPARRQPAPADSPEHLDDLLGYSNRRERPEDRLRRLTTLPGRPHAPEPWLLGSSPQSAVWAAERGLPYVFADFINPHNAAIACIYPEQFKPRVEGDRLVVEGAWVPFDEQLTPQPAGAAQPIRDGRSSGECLTEPIPEP